MNINNTDRIIHIQNKLTPEYQNVIEDIENELGDEFNKIKLLELRKLLRRNYQRMKKVNQKSIKISI